MTRSIKKYILLFIISAPAWWLFEAFNLVTQNWHYDGKQYFSDLEYFLLASLSFSTVMPAVFGSAELTSTFKWIKNIKPGLIIPDSNKVLSIFLFSGILLLLLIFILPGCFFPFIWIAVYFIIEPINKKSGNPTLLRFTKIGDWRAVISLSIGVLICAIFWEMWNYYSYPKWIYTVPLVNFLHVFEMPLLGYIGYPPFALELFALYNLTAGILYKKKDEDFLSV
jgi:hypothetical protein